MQPLPLLPITRLSFQLGILLATVAGIQLYVLRFREDMVDGARTSVYVATLVALFVPTAVAGRHQETRRGVSDVGRREKLSR